MKSGAQPSRRFFAAMSVIVIMLIGLGSAGNLGAELPKARADVAASVAVGRSVTKPRQTPEAGNSSRTSLNKAPLGPSPDTESRLGCTSDGLTSDTSCHVSGASGSSRRRLSTRVHTQSRRRLSTRVHTQSRRVVHRQFSPDPAELIGTKGTAVSLRMHPSLHGRLDRTMHQRDSSSTCTTRQFMATKTGSIVDDVVEACFRSFGAETRVLMANGTTKPISEIEAGDMVLAQDPETGEIGVRTVTDVWVHEDDLVRLEIDGDIVRTTEDHPFWNDTDKQWQRADQLDSGDLVLTSDGRRIKVEARLGSAGRGSAYNFTVEGLHTYHVLFGTDAVLVHNACQATSSNYRDLFGKQNPHTPTSDQIHYALPQKYESIMKAVGINIHKNRFLRAVDPKIHGKITTEWQNWGKSLGRIPTAKEITNFFVSH
jgi:hypothetical protein